MVLLLAAGCGAEPDPQLPDGGPVADISSDSGPPSAWVQPPPPDCPGMVTGTGDIWLDDPGEMSLVERPLYCLDPDEDRLAGLFITEIKPDSWQPASDKDRRFFFDLYDPHLHEVQVYYAVLGMVGYYRPLMSTSEPPPIRIELSANRSFTHSHYYLPDRLIIALGGVEPAMVPLQILCHEYAHHLIMRRIPTIDQLLNEGLADYLAAAFTENPRILSLDRLELPPEVQQDPEKLAVAARYLERSVDNELTYPEDLVTQGGLCETFKEAAAVFPAGSPLVPDQKLQQCASMSQQELASPEPHRTGVILAGALWSLRSRLGAPTVNALVLEVLGEKPSSMTFLTFDDSLVKADQALHGGANVEAIRQVFDGRGL
jgi:hypothetical protein